MSTAASGNPNLLDSRPSKRTFMLGSLTLSLHPLQGDGRGGFAVHCPTWFWQSP
jgi:hypothetical protein